MIENNLNKNLPHPSIHELSRPLLEKLISQAGALNIGVSQHISGATIVDAGIELTGSQEAGRVIAEICMGGLGEVRFSDANNIAVKSQSPVLACLGSQYAGWSLSHEKFFSLGSGPARSLAQREALFKELNYQDKADFSVLILETSKIPPLEIIEKVARDTKVKAENLTFILTPTTSLAGATQIAARVLEVALHKAHTLHFPLENIVSGSGMAPLPPVCDDFLIMMGRTNDVILFGGFVELQVNCSDEEAKKLAHALPSGASKDYGKTFAEVFKSYNMDFYL
ncbi:MAG TPA: methenyltetrahydromethanopterin cyclohydrolase, partial [Methylotenera sp.]|nr:methenyltetrahydromethanopterin cyclohydrolase [Methylotenera sp.]